MEDPEPNTDQQENQDPAEKEGSDNDLGAGEEEDAAKAEYVKKEYIARPYESPYGTENLVKAYAVRNSR